MVDIPRLKQHSAVVLEHALEEVAAVELPLAVEAAQAARPSLLIHKTYIAGSQGDVNFLNGFGL